MNKFTSLWLIVIVSAVYARPTEHTYTTKYDDLDLDSILNSDRLLSNYMKCLLENERCTPEGKELKKDLPDALKTGCSKCNEKQKNIGYKVIDFLIDKKPDMWKQLETKFDPEGAYKEKFRTEFEQRRAEKSQGSAEKSEQS